MSKLSVYPLIDETTQLIFWDNTIVAWGTGVSTNGRLIPGWKPEIQCFHTCLLISKLSKWLSKWEYFALCLHIHVYYNRCGKRHDVVLLARKCWSSRALIDIHIRTLHKSLHQNSAQKKSPWTNCVNNVYKGLLTYAKTILIVWWNHLKSSLLDACYSEVITESWTLISANDVEITMFWYTCLSKYM